MSFKVFLQATYVIVGVVFSCIIPIAQIVAEKNTPPTPRWHYLSSQVSTLNRADLVLLPKDPPVADTYLSMRNGSTSTWLSAESYEDGPLYYAGSMSMTVWWRDKPFCAGRGPVDCQVAAAMGYCRGSCSVLIPLVAFPSRSMANSNLLDAIPLYATVPNLQLENCPCHLFVQVSSYSPTGRSWDLKVRATNLYSPIPVKPDAYRPILKYLGDHPETALWFFLFVIGGVLLFTTIGLHNGLIARRNAARQAWASLDAELRRRHDLIPNLVTVVQAYAAHEQAVLLQLTQARAAILATVDQPGQRLQPESELVSGIRQLFAVSEAYPQLRADRNFLLLGKELVDTEDRIQAARRYYNAMVREYDTRVATFPVNLVAAAFRFSAEPYFELEPAVRAAADQPPPATFSPPGSRAAA